MMISATEKNWLRRVFLSFNQRVQFELTDIDASESHGDHIFNDFAQWCAKWHYTPKMVSVRSVRFSPKELPRERLIWNMRFPDTVQTKLPAF
jgi:hypothetical protein